MSNEEAETKTVCGQSVLAGDAKAQHEAKIRRLLREGDTITHTRCMGCIEEHIFTRYDESKTMRWLCGKPTRDTIRLGGSKCEADDITFGSVTHINRVPVDVCEFAVAFQDRLATPNTAIINLASQTSAA